MISTGPATEMNRAALACFPNCDVAILAAAVADYAPAVVSEGKIKKLAGEMSIGLVRTPDILTGLVAMRKEQTLVGFAMETGDLLAKAKAKLARKGCDLLVANDLNEPGAGFGVLTNRVTLVDRRGGVEAFPLMSKVDVAHAILDRVVRWRQQGGAV